MSSLVDEAKDVGGVVDGPVDGFPCVCRVDLTWSMPVRPWASLMVSAILVTAVPVSMVTRNTVSTSSRARPASWMAGRAASVGR
ncbi:hypothetical protein WDA79_07350 [Streptomyces sp. A475]|uniref:hypothetical protein n=1 Tax=Streptomyces sp. A475 TaxID=3131976 RepID=UPI0030C9B4AE